MNSKPADSSIDCCAARARALCSRRWCSTRPGAARSPRSRCATSVPRCCSSHSPEVGEQLRVWIGVEKELCREVGAEVGLLTCAEQASTEQIELSVRHAARCTGPLV